jgi:hypothetical protein
METAFEVITNIATAGSIALLLWGAAICLGELFASVFRVRAPDDPQDREDSEPWIGTLHHKGR